MGFFTGAVAGTLGTLGVQKLLERNKLELIVCDPEGAKWFTPAGHGVVVEETKDGKYLFNVVEDDTGVVEHQTFRSWDNGMRWAVGQLSKRGLVSAGARAPNPRVQTVEELRALRRGKTPYYTVEYLPYLGATDPQTGESFGDEHGTHEDIYTEYSEARRRYDALTQAVDTVETLYLYKVVPTSGRNLLAYWEDDVENVRSLRDNPAPNQAAVSAGDLMRRLKF